MDTDNGVGKAWGGQGLGGEQKGRKWAERWGHICNIVNNKKKMTVQDLLQLTVVMTF